MLIYAALTVCLIRLILRSVFVILTESELGIALIASSLVSMAVLLILLRKGGCSMVILYFCVEPLLSTFWICMILYFFNTNSLCHELGSTFCEEVAYNQLPYDYTRRPYEWWIVIIIPGLIFDILFLWFFRKPTIVSRIEGQGEVQIMLASTKDNRGGPGIGGVGLNNHHHSASDE